MVSEPGWSVRPCCWVNRLSVWYCCCHCRTTFVFCLCWYSSFVDKCIVWALHLVIVVVVFVIVCDDCVLLWLCVSNSLLQRWDWNKWGRSCCFSEMDCCDDQSAQRKRDVTLFVFCMRLWFGYSFCCVLSRQMHCMGIVFVVVFVVVLLLFCCLCLGYFFVLCCVLVDECIVWALHLVVGVFVYYCFVVS